VALFRRLACGIASIVLVAGIAGGCLQSAGRGPDASRGASAERGRYIVQVAGCNDCHTAGYIERNGAVPEQEWLKGSPLGWRGPWGTTYASNLRLYIDGMTEDQWLAVARALRSRPPMPWFNVQALTDTDLRSVYQFVRSLGPAGTAAPAFVPPGQPAPPPYVQFPEPPK
jgi:mono/diheme cytochrome c family protein